MDFCNHLRRWYQKKKRKLVENTGSFSFILINLFEYPIRKIAKAGVWPTKPFIFWLLLQNLLFLIEPKKILEFGSGRSTNYLSEYAFKNGAEFVSIEHNVYYYLKVKLGLKLSFLNPAHIKFVPLVGDWYKISKLNKFLEHYKNIELLFLDGPTNGTTQRRDPEIFYKYVLPRLEDIKIIFIDDTNWDFGEKTAEKIRKMLNLVRYDVKYKSGPLDVKMTLLLNQSNIKKIKELPDYLKGIVNKI